MQRIEKGQREIVAVRLGCLMKGIYQHSCGQNIAAYFMFASRHFFFLFSRQISTQVPFFFISFRWKDQIRSSVKIARQRFAWQGISFCYLYWNIIRFTLSPFSHLHLHFQLHFHLNFHFTDALLKIDSDRMTERERENRQRQLFDSIRFKSISIRFWRVTKLNLCQLQFYVSC